MDWPLPVEVNHTEEFQVTGGFQTECRSVEVWGDCVCEIIRDQQRILRDIPFPSENPVVIGDKAADEVVRDDVEMGVASVKEGDDEVKSDEEMPPLEEIGGLSQADFNRHVETFIRVGTEKLKREEEMLASEKISSPGSSIGMAARLAQPPPGFNEVAETEEPTIPGFGIVSEEDTEYYNFEAPTEAMRISQYVNPQTVDGMESITNGYLADFWKTNHKIHKRHIGFGEDGLPRVFEQVEYEIDGERMISLYHPNFVSKNIIPFF